MWSFGTGYYVAIVPAVDKGSCLHWSQDNSVYALNAASGSKIWSYPTNNEVESSPAIANGVVYIGSDDNNVYALNATSGTTIWTYGTGNIVDSSPAIANGVVYVGSNDNNIYAFGSITVPQPSPHPAVPRVSKPNTQLLISHRYGYVLHSPWRL